MVGRYSRPVRDRGLSPDSFSLVQEKNDRWVRHRLSAHSHCPIANSKRSPRAVVWVRSRKTCRLQSAMGRISAGLLSREVRGDHGRKSKSHCLDLLVAHRVATNSRSLSHGTLCRPARVLSKTPNVPPLHSQGDVVGFGPGPCRHFGQGRNLQAPRPASALLPSFCGRSIGDRGLPSAFLLLRICHHSVGATTGVENAAGATGRGRAHGIEQLSISVARLHHYLLRLWARAVRQGWVRCWVGPDLCDLRDANSSQPLVVAAVSVWSDGVGLEVADLRKTATDASVTRNRATQPAERCLPATVVVFRRTRLPQHAPGRGTAYT